MSDSDTKICTRCHEEKTLTEFYKCKKARDGLKPWCITCHKEAGLAYREKNRQRLRENSIKYYYANIDKVRAKDRKYRAVNREKNRAKSLAYYYANKARLNARRRERRGRPKRAKLTQEERKAKKREALERAREEKKRLIKEKILSDLRVKE
jgi:hypothetical protein